MDKTPRRRAQNPESSLDSLDCDHAKVATKYSNISCNYRTMQFEESVDRAWSCASHIKTSDYRCVGT